MRVEVIGLADARGPFGNSVVVNVTTLAGWPAPDNGGYYLSVPPGTNARDMAAAGDAVPHEIERQVWSDGSAKWRN